MQLCYLGEVTFVKISRLGGQTEVRVEIYRLRTATRGTTYGDEALPNGPYELGLSTLLLLCDPGQLTRL